MYTNQDWNFTAIAQYLYNGSGYSAIRLGDLLRAAYDRDLTVGGKPEEEAAAIDLSTLTGLGKIGQHYGVLSLSWTSLWKSKWDFSVLAIANFSDMSGFVKPTLSLRCLNYVTLSGGASFSWGRYDTEFADPVDLFKAYYPVPKVPPADLGIYVRPTMSLSLTASIGTTSF
jgi:hypothetical protein